MRRFIFISLYLIISLKLQCQDWRLFPKGQRSYYELSFNNQASFTEILVNDSINLIDDTIKIYFNKKQPLNTCITKTGIQNIAGNNTQSYLRLDSGFIFNDTSYFLCTEFADKSYFIFFNKAKQNDNWTLINSQISFTCDSVTILNLFDVVDSVKYFSINKINPNQYLNNLTFILSKNHGLIQFAPFGQLIYSNPYDVGKVSLIGYEMNGLKFGKFIPDFKDFFHLSNGDVLFWLYDSESYSFLNSKLTY